LGLGVTLALLWLLSVGPLPLARAESFNVTKFTDSADGTCDGGDCSLREAIIDANDNWENDTITLGTGTYVLTRTGTGEDEAATGDLDITDVLTITGDGPGQTIIDANSIDRVFEIHSGASTVVISGVTIINGNVTGDGGGIYHHGNNLILINTDVSSNTADYGGGIFVDSSNATLNGGQVRGNSAIYDGGGVYVVYGSVTLSGGQILSNTAINGYGGGVYLHDDSATFTQIGSSTIAYNTTDASGGGVYVGSGSAVLSDGQILGNDSGSDGGGVYVGEGSAALNGVQIRHNDAWLGGGVYLRQGDVTLSEGGILSNTAGFSGGGVYVQDLDATFVQTGTSIIAYNSATESSSTGGGVYVEYGSMTLGGGEIVHNSVNNAGGGVYVYSWDATFVQTGVSTIAHNYAYDYGGGVYVYDGSATLDGGQIYDNSANYGGGVYVGDGSVTLNGGRIHNNTASDDGGGVYADYGNFTMNGGRIDENTADGNGGGMCNWWGYVTLNGGEILSNTANAAGGGVYVYRETFVQTGTNTIAYNSAADGGGVYIEVGDVTLSGGQIVSNSVTYYGGGVYVGSATLIQTGTNTIAYNSAQDGGGLYVGYGNAMLSGGEIHGNDADYGGGVYVYEGNATLSGGQIISNTASYGAGVYVFQNVATFTQTNDSTIAYNVATDNGGGVYVNLGSAVLSGGHIVSNTASTYYGGGVYVYQPSATFTQTGITSTIAHNSAGWGGGLYIHSGRAMLSGGKVLSNVADNSGGGMYVSEGTATLNGSHVISNTATWYGGGVYVESSYAAVTLMAGQIISNNATYGGGVHVDGANTVFTQTGVSSIAHNFASNRGGGVLVQYGRAVLNGGEIINNSAADGGGVYVNGVNASFSQSGVTSTIAHNTATNDGGGIYVNDGGLTVNKGQVLSNTASNVGGGIYNENGTLTVINTTVSRNTSNGGSGGALYNQGGTTTLTFTTIASNTATSGGGGIYRAGGAILVQNTIVAHNSTTNCGGGLTSNGHNLDSGNTCGFSAAGDRQNTDPLLGSLADNGGDTLTHALLPGSPAIDAGICLAGVTTDQRGEPRPNPVSSFCDIGTYESDSTGTTDLVIVKAVTPAIVAPGDPLTYTLSFSNTGAAGAAGVIITDIVPVSVTVQSVISSGVSITRTGSSTYTWQVSDLAPGHSEVITIAGTLNLGIPAGDLNNTASITSTAVDTSTANNRSSAGVTVENVAPVADDATLFTDEDTPLPGTFSASDDNGETDILTFGIVTAPVSGTVAIGGTGSFVYTPTENLFGTDFFVYVVTDTAGLADTATVTVHVNAVNDAPTDVSLSNANVAENQPSGTLVGDLSTADVDIGDAFTYTLVPGLGDAGNVSFTIVNDQLRTAETFNYEAQITYTIRVSTTDSGGLDRAEIFTIAVTDANDAPVAVDDSAITQKNVVVTVYVLGNDTDEDAGDMLTVTAVGAPISGTVAISGSSAVVYTPTASSGTDTFTYTVFDGVQADTATVTVAVGDTVAWVDSSTGATLVYTDVLANIPVTVTIDVPGGAVSDVVALIYDELSNSSHAPPAGFDFAGIIFVLDAYLDTVLQPGFDFNAPITITLEYSPHALGNVDETTLALFYWTGSMWSASGIGVVEHDIANHRLIVTIEHLTEFALLGQTASLNVIKAVEGAGEGTNGTVNLPPSGVVTYTIVISNNGGGIASSVVVTDPLPPGISFGGWVVTGSAQLPPPGDAIEWGPHDVPAGESYTISFQGIVTTASAFAGQTVTNTAYFSSSNAGFGSSNDAVFTIASANTPPDISDIADQFTYVNTPIVIPFTIEDSETAPDDLNLSVESSNITLVPTATAVFGGLGVSRTVAITPTTNLTGMTTITITVSDGEDTDDTSFVLTVEPHRVYLPLVVSNHGG
jgi:uncharacterized repeat protein (TIGR01451 family)/CSLREA domain-containing protein